jgi:hypothetical protein
LKFVAVAKLDAQDRARIVEARWQGPRGHSKRIYRLLPHLKGRISHPKPSSRWALKGKKPSRRGPEAHLSFHSIRYAFFLCFIERATDRFETLPANSSDPSLLLKSATSAAKTYRLFAIKRARSQPRFS